MKIDDDLLLSVVFIGVKKEGNFEWGGTGFLVSLATSTEIDDIMKNLYLVTAKHVAEQLEGKNTCFRFAGVDKPLHEVEIAPPPKWHFHENPSVDVAVLHWNFPEIQDFDFKCIPYKIFVGSDMKVQGIQSERKIGLGNDVVMVSLFRSIYGSLKNLPIVRTGHIAMLPDEPIPVKINNHSGKAMAYLIDSRSIGGMSGSPVFLLDEPEVYDPQAGKSIRVSSVGLRSQRNLYFLGLVHGHWGQDASIENGKFKIEEGYEINMGIAHVVPAFLISEVIEQITKDV